MLPVPIDITGVVNLSDVMVFLGITDPAEQESFTENIEAVTWGDASYTLVTLPTFWSAFIDTRGSNPYNTLNRIYQAWGNMDQFTNTMRAQGVRYINLEA